MVKKTMIESSKKISKADKVYFYLKEKILDNEIPQGEFINLNQIAQELEVSKIPVREGVKKLENIGLVETLPQVGVRVKRLDVKELEQYALMRRELETLATRLAAEEIDQKTIKKLKEYADKMDEHWKKGDIHNYAIVNKDFHCLVYKSCNMLILYQMIVDLWDRSERTKWVFTMFPERMEHSCREHYDLIKALEKHDGKKAGDIIYHQKSLGFMKVLKVLKEIQEY